MRTDARKRLIQAAPKRNTFSNITEAKTLEAHLRHTRAETGKSAKKGTL